MRVSVRNGLFLFVVLMLGTVVFAADVDGVWTATVSTPMGDLHYTYTFKTDGKTLAGSAKTEMTDVQIKDGVVNGDEVSFTETLDFDGNQIVIKYKGKVAGDQINFDREVVGITNEKMVAMRKKA